MIFLDTHVVLWLYEGTFDKFPMDAKCALENEALAISPIVQLELQYLHEIHRITVTGSEIVNELIHKLDIMQSHESFIKIVEVASQLPWTRDPFDRLIVATAQLKKAKLLTKDETIRKHYPHCIWG